MIYSLVTCVSGSWLYKIQLFLYLSDFIFSVHLMCMFLQSGRNRRLQGATGTQKWPVSMGAVAFGKVQKVSRMAGCFQAEPIKHNSAAVLAAPGEDSDGHSRTFGSKNWFFEVDDGSSVVEDQVCLSFRMGTHRTSISNVTILVHK